MADSAAELIHRSRLSFLRRLRDQELQDQLRARIQKKIDHAQEILLRAQAEMASFVYDVSDIEARIDEEKAALQNVAKRLERDEKMKLVELLKQKARKMKEVNRT